MSLQEEIDNLRREIRTDGYPVSISEWISLYENGELDIHPEFQRFFRWSDAQKTSLIESLLLGIPIPSIFVSQRDDGVWDVVDGLQRLSTILQFVGILKDEEGRDTEPLKLSKTKYLPSLENVTWDGENALPQESKLILKRSKINSSIILRESDANAKYDLFQRLNTGGSLASDQEVRNCILVMLNQDMFRWLRKLADFDAFQECISLSERPILESYDMELVLRFLIFSNIDVGNLSEVGDVGAYLTEAMRSLALEASFDYDRNEEIFRETFTLLVEELGEESFKRYNVSKSKFLGGFLVSQFETVACGIGFNLREGNHPTSLRDKVASLWSNDTFTSWTGAGITASRRLPKLIPLGRSLFSS